MEIYSLFGHIIEAPGPSLPDEVNQCVLLLTPLWQEAARLMNRFKTFVDQTPFLRIEKIYDDTFGLEGVCYPYVGYHLLGDGSHRRMFMDGLRELYQAYGFSAVQEWPDHLGVMLQFLAVGKGEEEIDEIDEMISLYIVPSLRRMLERFEDRETPYETVLQALLLVLQGRPTRRNEKTLPETQEEYYLGK